MLRRCVFFTNQILGGGEPVVEHVLLLLEHGGFMPGFAVLVAAPYIRQSEPSTLLQPPCILGIPHRFLAQGEAAVPGHQKPFTTIPLQTFSTRDKHWYARAVLRNIEDFLQVILARVKGHLLRSENLGPAAGGVVVIDDLRFYD